MAMITIKRLDGSLTPVELYRYQLGDSLSTPILSTINGRLVTKNTAKLLPVKTVTVNQILGDDKALWDTFYYASIGKEIVIETPTRRYTGILKNTSSTVIGSTKTTEYTQEEPDPNNPKKNITVQHVITDPTYHNITIEFDVVLDIAIPENPL